MPEVLDENAPSSPVERYPSLAGTNLANKARNIGGDVMFIELTPAQCDAVIQVCIDHKLPVPTKDGSGVTFGSGREDEVTRDRVLFLVGARTVTENMRDPAFHRSRIVSGIRKGLSAIGLGYTGQKSIEQVAQEMRNAGRMVSPAKRDSYVYAWIDELKGNGADSYTAITLVKRHIRTLQAAGLLTDEEATYWLSSGSIRD